MNEEPLQNMPISPIPDSSFPNLFDDVAVVKTQLDCLGINYNPDSIANLLLEYDNNANRVSYVINRIIDEPPDVEITFEQSSPKKSSPPKLNTTSREVTTVDLSVQAPRNRDGPSVVIDLDDEPLPSKVFKSTNPDNNPFSQNLSVKEDAAKPQIPDSSVGELISMSDIEEFLNDKDSALETPLSDFLPDLLSQDLAKLNKLSNELQETSHIIKSATDLAKQDLKTGILSPLQYDDGSFSNFSFPDKNNQITSELNGTTEQTSGNNVEKRNGSVVAPSDETEYKITEFCQIKKITMQGPVRSKPKVWSSSYTPSTASAVSTSSAPTTSVPSTSAPVTSVTELLGFRSNLDKIGLIAKKNMHSSNFIPQSMAFTMNSELSTVDNFFDKIIDGGRKVEQSKNSKSKEIKTPDQSKAEQSTDITTKSCLATRKVEAWIEEPDLPFNFFDKIFDGGPKVEQSKNSKSKEIKTSDQPKAKQSTDITTKSSLATRKVEAWIEDSDLSFDFEDIAKIDAIATALEEGSKVNPTGSTVNPKVPEPVASSSKIEIIPCEPSTSGANGTSSVETKTDVIFTGSVPSSSKTTSEPMPKYLANLMEIFPDADTGYLRELCKSTSNKEKFPNKSEILQQLIDTVMENPNYPRRVLPTFETASETALSFDEKYQNILAILPNIDPEFVENKCKELTDDERYSLFVNELLTTKVYPTIKDYERRKETEKGIQAYTDNFTIPGFLEVFPDPEDYFLNKKTSAHHELSIAFLKDRYKLLRADDITKAYKSEQNNLSRTCLKLDAHNGAIRKTKRNSHECKWPPKNDVNFLQEISYINNRTAIKEYIANKKKERDEAFKWAKENNELFTCGCCYEDEVMKDDVIQCEEGHIFCNQCVKRMGEMKLVERKSKVECMQGGCDAEFSIKNLQKVLAPNAFSKFVKIKQTEEIKAAGIEGLVACPFCDFASIPPPEDKIFKCLNPDCMKESCRLCNEESHIPLRCDEVERDADVKARLLIEEKMTEALARECYKCKTKFIKEDGCNKMKCGHCGALSCYICRQPVKDYDHFNGDNGSNTDRCPLYSENDLLHVEAVRITAEEFKNKLLQENPNLNLKVDPTLVLPEHSYKKKNVPHFRQQQRGLVLARAIPADVPRDNLPPVDLTVPAPDIPAHLLQQAAAPHPPPAHQAHVHHRANVARRGNHHNLQVRLNAAANAAHAAFRAVHVHHRLPNRAPAANAAPNRHQIRHPQPDAFEELDSDSSYDSSLFDEDVWDADLFNDDFF